MQASNGSTLPPKAHSESECIFGRRSAAHLARRGIVSTLLLPLAWLAGLFIWRKRERYRRHPQRVWLAPVPVVVVGNIYVGGTGKTPVVIELVRQLALTRLDTVWSAVAMGWILGHTHAPATVDLTRHSLVTSRP